MSASSSSTRLSDLVRDSQLTAAFSSGLTLHSYHVSSRSARQRKQVVEEAWEVQRELGNGTFGLVRLERCVKGPRAAQLRAVKEIIKAPTQGAAVIDYYRELEAMAKFSNEKVWRRCELATGSRQVLIRACSMFTASSSCLAGMRGTTPSLLPWNISSMVTSRSTFRVPLQRLKQERLRRSWSRASITCTTTASATEI